jgi:hypothetical protein
MEGRLAVLEGVNAVERQIMQVYIQVELGAKALDEGHHGDSAHRAARCPPVAPQSRPCAAMHKTGTSRGVYS